MLKKSFFIAVFLITPLLFSQETGAKYLMIAHDNFYDATLPLARWKHKKGMKTRIIRLSEIGSTADQIRNYILNAYNTWDIKPEFLLLVGAPNFIPFPQVGTYTDNYYTNMDTDIYNEILSGRLTVHDTIEAKTVINKILAYERYPETSDTSWFLKGVAIANMDGDWPSDSIYWENMRYWARLMASVNYVEIDTFTDVYGNNANDVINAVNAGRTFVVYRGSGLNNWSSPFGCNPDACTNGKKLPIVLSTTCCCMGTGATPAAAERWFLTGTPTTPRGASGYFATTTVIGNGAHLRGAVAKGFADAVFADRKETFGEACENGRLRVYSMYSAANEYRGFTTIGDPQMNVWINNPIRISVDYPPVIHLGFNNVAVSVQASGQPVPNALVCMMQSDSVIYETGRTDSTGVAVLSSMVSQLDTIYLTVTGHTILPHEGFILVSPEGCFVTYLKHSFDDSIGGNDNGRINPGETVDLPVWVKNFGTDSAVNVAGIIRENSGYATILDSIANYGDMAPGDSVVSDPVFRLAVENNCPDGYMVNCDLICTDTANTWSSQFSLTVCAPKLVYSSCAITGENGNGLLEPGETANLILAIKNKGGEMADSAVAVCRCLSSYVDIVDSVSRYERLLPDSIRDNGSNPFVIIADSTTPVGTVVTLDLEVDNCYSVDTFSFSIVVGKENFLVWNPDLTPNPGQIMYSTLQLLGYSGEYATVLPADLHLFQSIFVCLGIWPQNYVIASTSPDATALISFLNNGGRLYLEGGDVWYYDPLIGGFDFGPYFNIQADGDGSSDLGPVVGQANSFTSGMNFTYTGENEFMDQISPMGSATLIFRDGDNSYNCGVAYDAGNYRTVGTSFELGGLVDGSGVSTKAALLDSIMHFFGIYTGIEEDNAMPENMYPMTKFEIYPNPTHGKTKIKFEIRNPPARLEAHAVPMGKFEMSLKIYDASGRLVKSFCLPGAYSLVPGIITWDGTDEIGRMVPAGVYFVELECGSEYWVKKIVFIR